MTTPPFEPEEDLNSIDVDEFKTRLDSLTPTQRKVFNQLRQGRANKVISVILDMGLKTVEKHSGEICKRLKADSRTHMISMYYLWLIIWRERR